jgi:DNA-binding LytR/AlgR family response regulator
LWLFVYVTSYQEESTEEKDLELPQEEETEIKKELIKTVTVKTGKRLHIIPISEIVCIQAYGDYVNIQTLQGVYLKEETLKYFNEHLPDDQFLRVHRSYIVNLNAIETIERYGRDQYVLLLKNKEKIKATLEGYRKLKERLKL